MGLGALEPMVAYLAWESEEQRYKEDWMVFWKRQLLASLLLKCENIEWMERKREQNRREKYDWRDADSGRRGNRICPALFCHLVELPHARSDTLESTRCGCVHRLGTIDAI